jgi:hypothetical protein
MGSNTDSENIRKEEKHTIYLKSWLQLLTKFQWFLIVSIRLAFTVESNIIVYRWFSEGKISNELFMQHVKKRGFFGCVGT